MPVIFCNSVANSENLCTFCFVAVLVSLKLASNLRTASSDSSEASITFPSAFAMVLPAAIAALAISTNEIASTDFCTLVRFFSDSFVNF